MAIDLSFKHIVGNNKNLEFKYFTFITIIEYSSLCLFFYFTYATPVFKKILIACYVCFFIILIYTFVNNNDKGSDFDSLTASAEVIFAVIFSVLFFYEEINNPNVTFIYGTKSFWIVVAFLLYLSVNLFPFIARNLVSEKEFKLLYPINYVANFLKNVLFAIAFRMFPPTVNPALTIKKSI